MQLGSDGAITGGAAEIWHWQSNPTDNSPNDTGFPGGYTDPSGNPIFPSDKLSFAEDDYTNTTGFFVIAGSFGQGSPNLAPLADPYLVHVGNSFSATNKTWTVEMVRAFNPSDAARYRVILANGANYFVAFAIWNGRIGESSHIKSVSQWYSLTISDQTPPVLTTTPTMPQPTAGGVSPTLSAVVAIGLLVVGVIIGILTRPKPKTSRP
jgi:cytochrome b558/566 subunit A